MKTNKIIYVTLAVLALGLVAYAWRSDIQSLLTYGLGDWPTHGAPSEGCPWKKEAFKKAGIAAYVGNCTDEQAFNTTTGYAMIFLDADKKIIGKWVTNPDYQFVIHVFTKSASQSPIEAVGEWYAKLTPEQRTVCEIQSADEPLQHFHDGRLMWTEDPHPMPHKTRYKIDIKPDVRQGIFQNTEPGETRYDYMCGHVVGTTFAGHAPDLEFDDRSPDKYLFIGSYGHEGPMIDLNSIQF